MNLRRWLHEHSLKLLAIRDTPNAIAGGAAIGIFLGFTPLFGLKTVLSILFAWLTGCNVIAAVIGVALHDLVLPVMPVVLRLEYDVGYWILSQPHQLPPSLKHRGLGVSAWPRWTTFFTVGKPMLLGSVLFALPFSAATFWFTRAVVMRHRKKAEAKAAESARAAGGEDANPDEPLNPA
jgi:uncharacterized protein